MKNRFLKSPVISKPPISINGTNVYTLYYKVWDINLNGSYENPREEILGDYVMTEGKDYHVKMTVCGPDMIPITHKFKKV